MKKYNKILFVLSFIVMILTINMFTFSAVALEGKNNGLTPINDKLKSNGNKTVKSTGDLIEMNLYDYGININNQNLSSSGFYPAFTQDYGGVGTGENNSLENLIAFIDNENSNLHPSIAQIYPSVLMHEYYANYYLSNPYVFYMGNLITEDLESSKPILLQSNINSSNPEAPDDIFWPVRSAMYNKLVQEDGKSYPALDYFTTAKSLKYLFSANSTNSVTKKNSDNITELFQYDESTGKYYYSSRNNHAEFDPSSNKFLVYDKIFTPNYLLYPFGNFMPLNKINTQTTQTSSINSSKISEMLTDIATKYNSSTGILKTQYEYLYKNLKNYDIAMTAVYGSNYTAEDGFEAAIAAIPKFQKFLPDTINKLYSKYDDLYALDFAEKSNFFFGFEMKTHFMQPKDGKINGEDMIFHFEGDDDVWVYVDGVLFLDLSGIHAQVGGEIDFAKGEVRYYAFDEENYGVSKNPINGTSVRTVKFSELGIDSSKLDGNTLKEFETYSLDFYYMERGASSGVMALEFNMPLVQKNAITIEKEVTSDEGTFGSDTYQFQIMKPNSGTTFSTSQLFIGANYSYDVYNSDDVKVRTSKTDSNGIIILNKGEYAVIPDIEETAGKYYVREIISKDKYTQYASVAINGSSIGGTTIKIGTTEYVAYSSSTNDMSSGAGSFIFTNKVNPNNLGKLSIKKILSGSSSDKSFKINVKIGGNLLPIGTTYKIGNSSYTVSEAGIINIKSGETAVIDKIFAGTSYEVVEESASAIGYTVSYKINDVATTNAKASGTVSASSTVAVEVINSEKTGVNVKIPVYKKTTNSDGVKYTYTFVLLESINGNDTELSRKTITVDSSGNGNVQFDLDYSYLNHTASQTIHKYKIYEEKVTTLNGNAVSNDKYTLYDETVYDVEVKVVNTSGELSATTTIKKGNDTVSQIVFNNERLASLTLEKIVDGKNTSGEFNFVIESVGLNGTYTTDTENVNVTFTNGKANVKLSHNHDITIYGLPYNSKFNITETNGDGYVTKYSINSGEFKNGSSVTNVTLSNKDTKVTFKNVLGYELPKTGSSGMLVMTFLGTLFMSVSSIYLLKRK